MLEHQSVSSVVKEVETTVLTFTNTTSIKNLNCISIEGMARSKIDRKRTSVSKHRRKLNFYRYSIAINDIIDVKVIHYEDTSSDFSATLNLEV